MKAFAVHNIEIDPSEGNGAIIFAQSKTEARRKFRKYHPYGCNPDDQNNNDDINVKREQSMDQYQGPNKDIPELAYAKIGWFAHCDKCGEGNCGDGFGLYENKIICHSCKQKE